MKSEYTKNNDNFIKSMGKSEGRKSRTNKFNKQ